MIIKYLEPHLPLDGVVVRLRANDLSTKVSFSHTTTKNVAKLMFLIFNIYLKSFDINYGNVQNNLFQVHGANFLSVEDNKVYN